MTMTGRGEIRYFLAVFPNGSVKVRESNRSYKVAMQYVYFGQHLHEAFAKDEQQARRNAKPPQCEITAIVPAHLITRGQWKRFSGVKGKLARQAVALSILQGVTNA